MDLYDWLLFLHVLAAFALVGSVVLFTVLLIAAGRTPGVLRLTTLGRRLWDAGGGGTLLFGVWLALHVQGYDLLDGWIFAALVLWAISAAAGIRLGMGFQQAASGEGPPEGAGGRPVVLWAVMTLAVAALLVDMIFKPGA